MPPCSYLIIKEIIPSSDEVIIITSSLMKDMNNTKNELYRANAIRVLCRIIDSQLLLQIERYLKQVRAGRAAVRGGLGAGIRAGLGGGSRGAWGREARCCELPWGKQRAGLCGASGAQPP